MYLIIFPWILTLIIEFAILWLFIRKEPFKLFSVSLLINSVTLPLATLSYQYLFFNLLLTETIVWLSESIFLKILLEIDYKKALIISLVANLVTSVLGLFIKVLY
jgi:hypothetical protein